MSCSARRRDAARAELARDEAMTVFLAGHDTTAAALTWAWHLLATHPAAAARLARAG